ncbi:MAG: Cardiolipin synthase [Chlamydiae bacterium]|nr:Cardiolipin synthase [Chlamydiota bacterium]
MGKRSKTLLAIFIPLGFFLWIVLAALYPPLPTPKHPLKFYSNVLCSDLKRVTIRAIENAHSSIVLYIYGLTDPDLIRLLKKKQAEGVYVKVFFDPKASKRLPKELNAYPVKARGLMHRKILIIDEQLTLLGTANFTPQSLKMHSNLIFGAWDKDLSCFLKDSIDSFQVFEIGETELHSFLLPDFGKEALAHLEEELRSAKKGIRVAMFTLTHPRLVDALIEAINNNIPVEIAIDRYTEKGASKKAITRLREAGAKIIVSQGSELLHHKWALIDESTLIMGSANWTVAAFTKNQDCLFLFRGLQRQEQKTLNRVWKTLIKRGVTSS